MAKYLVREVNEETLNYIQRLFYDMSMREKIIKELLTSDDSGDVLSKPSFVKYNEELMALNREYMIAHAGLEELYLPEGFTSRHQCDANIYFTTSKWVLSIKCDCGVKELEEAGYELSDTL